MPNIGTREDLSVLRFRKGGSTRYFTTGILDAAGTTAEISANILYAIPFFVARTEKFDRIAINVTVAAASLARLGIYADDGTIAPGRLVLDAGEVSLTPSGVKEITISQELIGGQLYWLALVSDAGATANRSLALASLYGVILGVSSALPTAWYTAYYRSFTYAALPDPFGTPTIGTGGPGIFLRKV